MNWEKFFKKYQLILLLSFIVMVMTLIKLTYKPSIEEQTQLNNQQITPIPTIIVTPTEIIPTSAPIIVTDATGSTKLNDIKVDDFETSYYPLKKYLPYTGNGFVIEKYKEPFTLTVKVSVHDLKDLEYLVGIEDDVMNWIEKKGGDPTTHKIDWQFARN